MGRLFLLLFSVSLFLAAGEKKELTVVTNGWHSGLVFRAADVNSSFWPEIREFAGAKYVEVGWGDAAFYRKRDPGVWDYLYAALWPSASLLHIREFELFPVYHDRVTLRLDGAAYDAVCRFVAGFYARKAGRAQAVGEGLYPNSRFYRSGHTYHLLRTCNVWTAQALEAGGVRLDLLKSVRSDDLFLQLRGIQKDF
jgi:uncharacterized protein (TIGR02117 family)